ncbi:AGE family epimerase/isomerase [Portibacter lacus]|uniref:N-acylglucosamine 2-epimerase n=1 Tax=Portibacter lacus TaxID=1099794 RepID=A0AA37SJY1_9BACT|nr:AGE family epimerase/isomerase [Portibacter lacus]GLR15976.1 N-acylglucosamine 2-epimerase [Portibacter lacus]
MLHSSLYKDTLLENVIPFWENHSIDHEFGGYFTCLDRKGDIFDTDKFIWLQCRQVWMFSFLYNNVAENEKWLDIARIGIDFLLKCGRDAEGNFYFSTTREGEALVQPYNIYSDCFATMAFAQYGKATQNQKYIDIARATYHNIIRRSNNPKGKYEKRTSARPLKSFSLPMILSNLVMELSEVLDAEEQERTIDYSVHEVMNQFFDPESGLILENVNQDGSLSDTFEGRLINPGHGLEAMWFMMDIGEKRNDQELIHKCCEIIINLLEFGWDDQYGGIFYFLDIKGHPPQQLEWDQKLWWVHLETLIALSKAYYHTGNQELLDWYNKVHDYTWSHFPDQDYDEWFGYLNRRGEPLLDLKGGKWKGCFHVPRAMYQCWKTFELIENNTNKNK